MGNDLYLVVSGIDTEEIESQMSRMIANGWLPAGGISWNPNSGLFIQAVYRLDR